MSNVKLKDLSGVAQNFVGVDKVLIPSVEAEEEFRTFYATDSATATAEDLLLGKVAFNSQGSFTGLIPTKTDADITSVDGLVTIPAGYYAQQYTKFGDPTGDATVTSAEQILTPFSAYSKGTKYEGTMPNNGQVTKTITTQGETFVIPKGYHNGTGSVTANIDAGQQGTPVATKGEVTEHSISITPSCTDTTGYIEGTTKTGEAVTVTASELVSGTLTVAQNEFSFDCTNFATVDVRIPVYNYSYTIL